MEKRVSYEERQIKIGDIKTLLEQGYHIEVDSPDGWVGVNFFIDKGLHEEYVLNMDSGDCVLCNAEHLFETSSGWISARELNGKGKVELLTKHGYEKGTVTYTGQMIPIVDINVEHENHRYYTNGISSHNTGVGKSLFMCHCASHNLTQGKNVLYITMEMAEEKIAERIDANLLNVTVDELSVMSKDTYDKKIARIKEKTVGKLIVKEYPTAGAGSAHFRHLINELRIKRNFIPDVIYIDYLNICSSSRIKSGSNANSYTLIKSIAEELRGLAVEFNVPLVSATQTTRCLALDTIVTINGNDTTIDHVKVGDKIQSNESDNIVTAVHYTGKQKAYKITLSNGQKIVCSGNHIFPTADSGDITINNGLKPNMYLQVKQQ